MRIKLVNVSKYYYGDGQFAKGLEGVNLSFDTDGSFVVITGESGAGKSTLIRILTGIEEFDEGEIFFDDKPLTGLSADERQALYAANVSFVFQDYNLVESLTALDNIVLALLKHGLTVKEAKKIAQKALDDVGLGKYAKKKTSKLSGGERQRVAIARSLALKSKVIIFDEPTGNLDPNTGLEIISLINKLRENRLIVYVTHDYPLVEQYATRHIVLSDNHVESDVTLKHEQKESVPMALEEPKMRKSAYFYGGKAFTFSRTSRLISTSLVLLAGALFAFGVASLSTMAFVSTDITSNFVDMNHPTFISYPCGNLAEIKKKDTTADEPYLLNFTEDDYVRDNGGLLLYQDFRLIAENRYLSMYTNKNGRKNNSYYVSYLGGQTPFILGNVMPEGTKTFAEDEISDEEIIAMGSVPASIVCYDKGSFITSKLGSSIVSGYNSPLGIRASLAWDSKYMHGLPTNKLTNEGQEYFLSAPTFYVNKVLLTSDASFKDETTRLVISSNDFKKCREYAHRGYELERKGKLAEDGVPTLPKVDKSLAAQYANTGITCRFGEKELSVLTSGGMLGTIRVPSPLIGQEDTAYFFSLGIKIPLKDIIEKNELQVLPSGRNDAVNIIPSELEKYIFNVGGYDAFYAKDKTTAKAIANASLEAGTDSLYFPAERSTRELYEVVDFSRLPLWYRVVAIAIIFAALLLMAALGLILRSILNRYYFRQVGDQNVLTWIGYGKKDLFIINLLPSLFIEIIAILIVYTIGLTFLEGFGIMFTLFPTFYILSILAALLFALLTSLPVKKKGGARK